MVSKEFLNRGFHCVVKFLLFQHIPCYQCYHNSVWVHCSLYALQDLILSVFKFYTYFKVRDYVMFYCHVMIPGAEALAHGCPKLKSFISKGCRQINDRAVSCLARHCRNLEVINLHGCTVSYVVSATWFSFLFTSALFSVRVKDNLTFRGLCIVVYSYNESWNALFLNFIW